MQLAISGETSAVKGIERMAREARIIIEKPTADYLQIEAKTILNKCTSPRVPFTWTINPYRGCEFVICSQKCSVG